MDQWLDTLSEDWPSQPPSRRPSLSLQASSPRGYGTQSRIPRFNPRASSGTSSGAGKEPWRTASGSVSSQVDKALRERTPSSINASRNVKSNDRGKILQTKDHVRELQTQSSDIEAGTVQHVPSPTKQHVGKDTPEWKRRLLQGKKSGIDQTDLFAPMGLESVFKPPTILMRPQEKEAAEKLFQRSPLREDQTDKEERIAADNDEVNLEPPSSSLVQHVAKDPRLDRGRLQISRQEDRTVSHDKENIREESGSVRKSSIEMNEPADQWDTRRTIDDYSKIPSDQSHNEKISTCYISRHETSDGAIDYAAIDTSLRTLQNNVERLQRRSQTGAASPLSDGGVEYSRLDSLRKSMLQDDMDEVTSQSLPGDLSMGTDAFVANGGFVNLHRGGYSRDASFQKRTLSPSSSVDVGPKLIDDFEFPDPPGSNKEIPKTPPRTPKHHDPAPKGSSSRPKSSGSPLKLFDKHDTFTMTRLARQISRFEETLGCVSDVNSMDEEQMMPSTPSPGPKNARPFSRGKSPEGLTLENSSSFGRKELEGHQFSSTGGLLRWPKDPQASADARPIQRKHKAHTRSKSSPTEARIGHGKSQDGETRYRDGSQQNTTRDPSIVRYSHHGKRLPLSPIKDTVPKRRRTLEEVGSDSQIQEQLESLSRKASSKPESNTKAQGRKRKDARYNDEYQNADPEVIAARLIRRPRGPNASQSYSYALEPSTSVGNVNDTPYDTGTGVEDPPKNEISAHDVDPPTQMIAGALATIALNAAQDATYGSRKASVTTSDFFNEAQQIMALIRADNRPRSRPTTTDTSEVTNVFLAEEDRHADSTRDDFSRPPSREGRKKSESPRRSIPDMRLASHLRKFEDEDDLGLALPSSLHSLKIGHEGKRKADRSEHTEELQDLQSDPPNVRIFERIQVAADQQTKNYSDGVQVDGDPAAGGQSTSRDSSRRSIATDVPTGSSRSSFSMKKIAPESVAHLLSDQMADMVFDHERKLWVKRKTSSGGTDDLSGVSHQSDQTQEDFFGDIPDLSVDEMEELRRVKHAVDQVGQWSLGDGDRFDQENGLRAQAEDDLTTVHSPAREDRPKTADGKSISVPDDSSAPSKVSRFAWSGPMPETRATSYGDNVLSAKAALPIQSVQRTAQLTESSRTEDEVEREFSILEGRDATPPVRKASRKHQARVVTVAFSSPLVQSPYNTTVAGHKDIDYSFNAIESPCRNVRPPQSSIRRASIGNFQKSARRQSSHRLSTDVARPMSRVDENEEFSLIQYSTTRIQTRMGTRGTSSSPPPRSLVPTPKNAGISSIDYDLSPLPEFSFNQVDRPIENGLDAITKRRFAGTVGSALSLTAQELVKHLTDLEPYEPYWEYLRTVDLSDRGLKSLHMLQDFCGQVEELDISQNRIGELNGIPASVRMLNVRENRLSDLSAWHNLMHLQYLDVSGNRLRNLSGLSNLVHLRGLRADDNDVESLDGIGDLDALLSLSVAGNSLRLIDFENFNLQRLTELNMQRNNLVNVSALHCLPALKFCRLDENELQNLDFDEEMPCLEELFLSKNDISSFSVRNTPVLRKLELDQNCITSVQGAKEHKALEAVSLREQRMRPVCDIDYDSLQDVRKLSFGGTTLNRFAATMTLLNLNVLELASTGLQALPAEFGIQCRNLRVLNLNYNAIQDLRPLQGIERLLKLHAAGNRLSRLRRTAALLKQLASQLADLDLRNNPLTIGFYTPQSHLSPRGRSRCGTVVRMNRSAPHPEPDANDGMLLWTQSKHARRVRPHGEQQPDSYLLSPLDGQADQLSRARLDEDTILRRRVYEMLISHACPQLERLDSIEVDHAALGEKDEVWGRLIELGILKAKEGMEEHDEQ